MSSISQLPKLYLLRGYYAPVPNTPKAKGNIQLVSQVEPLPEQLLFLGDPQNTTYDEQKPAIAISNENAVLYAAKKSGIEPRQPLHPIMDIDKEQPIKPTEDGKRSVIVVPPTAAGFIAEDKKEDWQKELIEFMKRYGQGNNQVQPHHTLAEIEVAVDQMDPKTGEKVKGPVLRSPIDDPQNPERDKRYRDWYKRLKSQKISHIVGYILPRTRVLTLSISRKVPVDVDKEILVFAPGAIEPLEILWNKELNEGLNELENHYMAVISGSPDTLPKGFYRFVIQLDGTTDNNWSQHIANGGYTGSPDQYQIGAMLNFTIENIAGEFDLVTCNPITLEESLIQQFPHHYAHILEAAMAKARGEVSSLGSESASDSLAGIDEFVDTWSTVNAKGKLIKGLLDAGISTATSKKGRAKTLARQHAVFTTMAQAIHDHFSDNLNTPVKSVIDFGFTTIDGYSAWGDLSDAIGDYAKNISKPIKDVLLEEYIKVSPTSLSDLKKYKESFPGKLSIPYRASRIFGSGIAAANLGVNVYGSAKGLSTIFDAELTKDKVLADFAAVNVDYYKVTRQRDDLNKAIDININFKPGSSYIDAGDEQMLRTIAVEINELLNAYPDATIEVQGHTCNLGGYSYNLDLSERRAKAVKDMLVKFNVSSKKISSTGYGYQKPLFDNELFENRIKNRRVKAVLFSIDYEKGCPEREGIGNLERFRATAVAAEMDYGSEKMRAAMAAANVALGIAMVIPVTAVVANAIAFSQVAGEILGKVVLLVDNWLADQYLAQAIEDRKDLNQLGSEFAYNRSQLKKIDGLSAAELQKHPEKMWEAQYRLRCEAVSGLMALLFRASIEASNSDELVTLIEKYKVDEYIDNFILNDQWSYPYKNIYISMDQYWLFAVDPDFSGLRDANALFGLDDNYRLLSASKIKAQMQDKTSLSIDGIHMLAKMPHGLDGHLVSNFHQYFPVHHFSTKDIKKFAEVFNVRFSHINKKSYLRTAVYYYDKDQKSWKLLVDRPKVDEDIEPLSPTIPIRVLIVFKDSKEGLQNPAPVTLQVNRYDNLNIYGPVYEGIALPLDKADLSELSSDEAQYAGKMGCIIEPFFQLPLETYRGIKPMARFFKSRTLSELEEYYREGNLTDMRYGFTCQVGKSLSSKIDLPLNSQLYSNSIMERSTEDEFPLSVGYTQKSNEFDAMITHDFLTSRTKSFNYGKLFEGSLRVVPLISLDGKAYVGAHRVFDKDIETFYSGTIVRSGSSLIIQNFDWNTPVSFAFICSSDTLHKKEFSKSFGLNSRRYRQVGFSVDINEVDGLLDSKGPNYQGNIQYWGEVVPKVSREFSQIVPTVTFDRRHYGFRHFSVSNIFRNDRTTLFAMGELDVLEYLHDLETTYRSVGSLGQAQIRTDYQNEIQKINNKKRHIYVGYYQCKYVSPKGKAVESIRPFGRGMLDLNGSFFNRNAHFENYFKYAFDDFQTSSNSDFSSADLKQFEFHFPSPRKIEGPGPWTQRPPTDLELSELTRDRKQARIDASKMTAEEMKVWLEENARLLDANEKIGAFDRSE